MDPLNVSFLGLSYLKWNAVIQAKIFTLYTWVIILSVSYLFFLYLLKHLRLDKGTHTHKMMNFARKMSRDWCEYSHWLADQWSIKAAAPPKKDKRSQRWLTSVPFFVCSSAATHKESTKGFYHGTLMWTQSIGLQSNRSKWQNAFNWSFHLVTV